MAEKENQVPDVSRRGFLQGAGIAVAGITAGSLIACNTEKPKAEEKAKLNGNLPATWDIETDIAIVGLGDAALSAAIAAKIEGVEKVLCLEVASEALAGGSSRASGQMLMIPDSVEGAITYQTALNAGYKVEEEIMRDWAEGVCYNMQWLTQELGYDLQQGTHASPEFPGIPGGESIKTYYVDGILGKASLWKPLMETAADLGVEVMYEMRATELIYNYETKEVYGVIAGGKAVKANKGVILACGGFANNPEMMSNYYCSLGCHSTCWGGPFNVGDGVKMAQQIGADLWHMNSYAGAALSIRSESRESRVSSIPYFQGHDFIFVNNEGKRFMYEETYGDLRHGKRKDKGVWPMDVIPTPSYVILGKNAGSKDFFIGITSMGWAVIMGTELKTVKELLDAGIMYKADTIEEIARKIGYPEAILAKTLETYNQSCAEGVDKEFKRGEAVYSDYYFNAAGAAETQYGGESASALVVKPFELEPLEPPFYVAEIALAMINTQGGAKRNGKSEVLDLKGNPIPRLYSAGEFGTIYGYMYNGGGNVTDAVASGRKAGQNCAALDPWKA